jgi:ssDNA-binding Zn-finger/Zn-ribbon topoisomerase 1
MGLEQIRNLKEQAKLPKTVKKYIIPKKSSKKLLEEKNQKIEIVKPKKKGWFDAEKIYEDLPTAKYIIELADWFEDRHKEMTGICKHCGGKTQKGKENYRNSIAHILPKAYFKSVATNPNNWIELCFYGNSCHSQMDNKMLDLTEMNCWDEIVTKFVKIYPSIAKEERRRIPKILLEYIETEK